MADNLDPRIVRVGIEVNGRVKYYEGLDITATGTKFANPNQNECEVTIDNIDKATRDFILTETSPFNLNRTPKTLILEAGRASYGSSVIYKGNIAVSSVKQPPDISIVLKCLTGNYKKGNVLARSGGAVTSLKSISQGVANDLEAPLTFEATDKKIANYSFTGGALKQMNALEDAGDVDVYFDNNQLVVKDRHVPLNGKLRILNLDSGMIGIPELTEHGIKVVFLADNQTVIGGALKITSLLYPSINGTYVIYKLGFHITNRDVPFYFVAECKRLSA
jgi:hypothetical protein